mgnify:CR=1 FL=1
MSYLSALDNPAINRSGVRLVGDTKICRLVADLNGLSQYMTIPKVDLVAGDVVRLKFIAPTSWSTVTNTYLLTGVGSTDHRLNVYSDAGVPKFAIGGYASATTDGNPLPVVAPTDGLEHTVTLTKTNAGDLSVIGARFTFDQLANSPIYDLKINDGSVYNYPIDDGFANNPVIRNAADPSGLTDGTAVNFTEATWIEVCK